MKVVVVTVYIGPLPANMPLWLASCEKNANITWQLVTDQDNIDNVPNNVRIKKISLKELNKIFSKEVGFPVSLDYPYKLCDFKPLFFSLIDDLSIFDYWGFCDLDVIFGDISHLSDFFGKNDMILSDGHLRFIRNTEYNNNLYREINSPKNWSDILTDPNIFGMDEHPGINRVFLDKKLKCFVDPSKIADIDPSFRQMRLLPQYKNFKTQAFFYDDGKIFREYWHRGSYNCEEFLYIHFQKRKLRSFLPDGYTGPVFITPTGFHPRPQGRTDAKTMSSINGWKIPNKRELMRVLRMRIRMVVQGSDLYSSIRS